MANRKRKVMILMAKRTGSGHRASANALEKHLVGMGYDVRQVNCFTKMGKIGRKMEAGYIPLTTRHPLIWKMAHGFSQIFTGLTHAIFYKLSKKGLLADIKKYQPDLIISVHCNFTRAVSKLLRKNNLSIPFMINVIDLVRPPRVWRDKDAVLNFLPTKEVSDEYVWSGFDVDKLVVSGFPIREDIIRRTQPKIVTKPIKILMVNPSISLRKSVAFVEQVLRIPDTEITVVCGRDERLFRRLTDMQAMDMLKGVKVLGFIENMHELLAESHILMTKAGPNMILEGSRSGTAIVVTGHIPGQEAHNYEYVTKNGFGFKCENPQQIYAQLTDFIQNHELERCLFNTLHAEYNDGAQIIAAKIDEYLNRMPELIDKPEENI